MGGLGGNQFLSRYSALVGGYKIMKFIKGIWYWIETGAMVIVLLVCIIIQMITGKDILGFNDEDN